MITKTVATSKTCGPCMMLKNKLKALGLEVEVKDFTIPEDVEFFKKHSIKSVPRLVVETEIDGETTVQIIQGIDDIVAELTKKEE